jgi:hypothetical protein
MSSSTCKATVWSARILGFCVYLAAFFLPACREIVPAGQDSNMLKGYTCAWITLINTFKAEIWHSEYFLAVFSGWINPLILLYLIFLAFPKLFWPRRILAGIILCFIAATWILFYRIHLQPLVGHYLWIAGILLILAGEACAEKNPA